MSAYYSFNDFMTKVINDADSICKEKHGVGLEKLFDASYSTYRAIISLIDKDWLVFLAVVALLALGPLGILLGITSFLATPVGIIVIGVLGVGAAATIYKMYQERLLPQAVKSVGEKYKSSWEEADGNRSVIDNLASQAAADLYFKALHSGTSFAAKVLNDMFR